MPLTAIDSRASLLRSAPSAIWLATEVLTETRHFSGNRADIRRQTAIHALRRAVQLLDQAQDQQPIVV